MFKLTKMTVISYFLDSDSIFRRCQKLIRKNGIHIIRTNAEDGTIHGLKKSGLIGPNIEVLIKICSQSNTQTRLEITSKQAKGFLLPSQEKLKKFESRLVEQLYSNLL